MHKKASPYVSMHEHRCGRTRCAKKDQHCNREPGFFVIALGKLFSFRADWHQDARAKPLVQQYQTTLDSVLRCRPRLERCVTHCVHCGIRFLTDPRNAGRRDLRCPFGCRREHRRKRSNQRSTAYYRTDSGRQKKERLNGRRSRRTGTAAPPERTHRRRPRTPANSPVKSPKRGELRMQGFVLNESMVHNSRMLPYVQTCVLLIDGLDLGLRELARRLCQALRQHSMAGRSRTDYVLHVLNQHPP